MLRLHALQRLSASLSFRDIGAERVRVRQVLQIGLGHGSDGHGLSGLTELSFLECFEVVHGERAVGLEPVFVGLDGQ